MSSDDGEPRLRHRRDVRRLLSLFFVLNFGSIAVYHLPSDEVDIPVVPEPVDAALETALPPVKRTLWPVARHWLDATATRQRWTLFAPYPAEWTARLEVVAYYPEFMEAAPGGGWTRGDSMRARGDSMRPRVVGRMPDGRAVTWSPDTVRVVGGEDVPYPHWFDHRRYRLVFNMGYVSWGEFYRPIYAAWLCRTLRNETGRLPDGLEMASIWHRIDVPWIEGDEDEAVRQALGGFTCFQVRDTEPPPYLVEVSGTGRPGEPSERGDDVRNADGRTEESSGGRR